MEGANRSFKIGEIYIMDFCGDGSEQRGRRPGLVFQNNLGNMYSPNIIALPLTSCLKKTDIPTHVTVSSKSCGLKRDSMVLCENPERMSKDRIGKYVTTLSLEQMRQVATAYLLATSAIAFINPDSLVALWEKASALNNIKREAICCV